MKKTFLYSALAICLSGLVYSLNGASILYDDFEYADQTAFQAAWPVFTSPGGTLVTTNFLSGSKSIGYGTAAARNQRNFTATGTVAANNVVRFGFDFYDANASVSPYRQYANLQSGAANAGSLLISLGMNNNQTSAQSGGNYYMARIVGYNPSNVSDPDGGPAESVTGAGVYFKLNDFGVGLRSTGWHNLAVEIHPTEFLFFVDGFLAEKVANTFTLNSYDHIRLGSGVSSTTPANFDNISVMTIVPEPSSLAFALLGGFGLFIARMRRQ